MSPEDFINAFQQPQNIKSEFERGYFQPSKVMISLTDKFIEGITKVISNEIRVQKLTQNKTLFFVMVDKDIAEVYSLLNNGYEASWQYQGTHRTQQ